jgi:hypothetical protein
MTLPNERQFRFLFFFFSYNVINYKLINGFAYYYYSKE